MMAHTVRSVPLSIFKDQGPPVDTILLWPPFPVSWALWIFKLRLRFVQIWVRWVKSRPSFQKYKLAQNDEISFVLFEISSFGRLQTIPQQEFLHWMWNDTLFEPISLRSVRFWGRPLRVSYKRRFVLKQFVNQYPKGHLLKVASTPHRLVWHLGLIFSSFFSNQVFPKIWKSY